MAGAAVALGGVFVVQAGSSGGTSGSPTTTLANATSGKVGWVGTVPFCVLFLRWTQSEQAITGSAQATDLHHHLTWSRPLHGSINGSEVKIEIDRPGLCRSHGTRLSGTVSGDSLLLDFAQPHSMSLPVTFEKGSVADFDAVSAATERAVIPTGSSPARPSVVAAVSAVPHTIFSQVGRGNATQPEKLAGPPLAGSDGRPRIVWIGAEYCSSCAAERWPLVIALSRVGTFTGLRATSSTALDGYPNTRSFSFYQSTYTSPYITFEAVELFSNIPSGTGFTRLDSATPEQQRLMDKFDQPPYVDPSSRGGLPFIDFANQYSIAGVTFPPAVLRDENADAIAVALFDPNTNIAKGVIGSANEITAAICKVTKDQPINVCSDPVVKAIERQLG